MEERYNGKLYSDTTMEEHWYNGSSTNGSGNIGIMEAVQW